MDITLDVQALTAVEAACCFSRNKVMYIKFENALKMIKYDNATEQWTLADDKRKETRKVEDVEQPEEKLKDTVSIISRLT